MKHWFNRIAILLMVAFSSLNLLAQDKKVDLNINVDKGGNWYAQPWVWIVGGAVFILLLVALIRNGKND
ncbi:MAG: hypothetical protein ABIX01_20855 [Chitinophagaceae bacterium]